MTVRRLIIILLFPILSVAQNQNAENFFESGKKNLQESKYLNAIKDLTKAISLKPNYGFAYLERAKAKMGLEQQMKLNNNEYIFDLLEALKLGVEEAIPLLFEKSHTPCYGLQRALDEPEIVFCCDFSSTILTDLPSGSNELNNVLRINLFNNHFSEITPVFSRFKYLLYLDLSSNHLLKTGEVLDSLKYLVELNLSKNHLSKIPESIGNLKHLKKLDIHSNKLTDIPSSIGSCINLEYLDLSSNELTNLPETISLLKNLKVLNLTGNVIDKKHIKNIKTNLPHLEIYI